MNVVQGICGWRLDSNVKGYESYQLGEAPPEPQAQDIVGVDEHAAEMQLPRLHEYTANLATGI